MGCTGRPVPPAFYLASEGPEQAGVAGIGAVILVLREHAELFVIAVILVARIPAQLFAQLEREPYERRVIRERERLHIVEDLRGGGWLRRESRAAVARILCQVVAEVEIHALHGSQADAQI